MPRRKFAQPKVKSRYYGVKIISDRRKLRDKLRDELVSIFGSRCWYCGTEIVVNPVTDGGILESGLGLQIEHIISKSKGGLDDIDNYALSCGNCNRAKTSQSVIEFIKWLAFIRSSQFQCFILSKLPKSIVNQIEDTEWDRLAKD